MQYRNHNVQTRRVDVQEKTEMEESSFIIQIEQCLDETTRGRLSDQVLPRVKECALSGIICDETLHKIASDTSSLSLVDRLADARLNETYADRIDGLGIIAVLIGLYMTYDSKNSSVARSSLACLTPEQQRMVFSTTDTLAVVNDDADPLQRSIIRALTEAPSDDAACEVAHVFLNRMASKDIIHNLKNALKFCEEISHVSSDMVSDSSRDANNHASAEKTEYEQGSDPVESGVCLQIPAPQKQAPHPPSASIQTEQKQDFEKRFANLSDDLRKYLLPDSFNALNICADDGVSSLINDTTRRPATPPPRSKTPEPASPEEVAETTPGCVVRRNDVSETPALPPMPPVPPPVPQPTRPALPPVPPLPCTTLANSIESAPEDRKDSLPRRAESPKKSRARGTIRRCMRDHGTSMSPTREYQREHEREPATPFYTSAALIFQETGPDQDPVPDVVDSVLTRVDSDFSSPRPSSTPMQSSSTPSIDPAQPSHVASVRDSSMRSFTSIASSSPSATGDELFSKMYAAFLSSKRSSSS